MFVMTKPAEREAARRLRAGGMPYKRIAAQLTVSPSSVYAWTRDIALTQEQVERNRRGPGAPWTRRTFAGAPPPGPPDADIGVCSTRRTVAEGRARAIRFI
jgi:hypothetical protein